MMLDVSGEEHGALSPNPASSCLALIQTSVKYLFSRLISKGMGCNARFHLTSEAVE